LLNSGFVGTLEIWPVVLRACVENVPAHDLYEQEGAQSKDMTPSFPRLKNVSDVSCGKYSHKGKHR
jgi:hypothetical protein